MLKENMHIVTKDGMNKLLETFGLSSTNFEPFLIMVVGYAPELLHSILSSADADRNVGGI